MYNTKALWLNTFRFGQTALPAEGETRTLMDFLFGYTPYSAQEFPITVFVAHCS